MFRVMKLYSESTSVVKQFIVTDKEFRDICVTCPASFLCLTHLVERVYRTGANKTFFYFYDGTGVGYPMEVSKNCPGRKKGSIPTCRGKVSAKSVSTKPA